MAAPAPPPPQDRELRRRLRALRRSLPSRSAPKVTPLKTIGRGGWAAALRRRVLVLAALLGLAAFVFPPFFWPVQAPVSSGFLFRLKPDQKAWGLEIHHGIDLAAPRGTPVRSSAWGLVTAAGRSPDLGNYVRVSHPLGFDTLYGHMDALSVRAGDLVVPGWHELGRVGSTGRSTGPHLHFGVFWGGVALPPEVLLGFHSLRRAVVGF